MPNQSPDSSGPALAEVPAIRSFEFDSKSIGNVQTSVNQFRGIASVPIDLITLPGRPGLDVKISAIYGSNVRKTVGAWNVDAPTGVLGLGWDMPFEQIVVAKGQSDSSVAAGYYLLSNGSGNPLIKTGQTAGGQWIFQARNYQFWSILYDPSSESWTIVKENGFVYTYGAKNSAAGVVQWGVRWGNWIGSTARTDAQANSAVGWNLASIQSLAGDQIAYEYLNVTPSVGAAGGLQYTQAAYIRKIHDSYGRIVTFNYEQKYGALNPSSKGIVEYQAANAAKPAPNAFQDRYETSYLDNIEISNADSELLFRLQFTYDFVNSAGSSNPNSGLFYKRVLTSVWRQSPTGATLPSMDFAYNTTAGDLNFGALRSITYPQGATAGFTYKKLVINAPKSAPVNNPLTGSLPGVWHGDDYVVMTFCVPSGGLKVLVYSFNGRWVSADVTAPGMNTLKADANTVAVATQENYFAVFLRNTGASRDQLYVFSKKKTDYGQWNLQPIAAQGFPLKSATAVPSQIAVGSDFITVYNPDYTQGAFQGFSYTWQSDNWAASALLPSPSGIQGATGVSMAGYDHYYIVFIYKASSRQGTFQILYRDLTGGWHLSGPWTNGSMDVVSENGVLLFNWSLAPTFAVGTYVTSSTANTINYSLRLFDWDQNFRSFDANNPTVVNMQTPVTGSTPKYSVFQTSVSGSSVANNYVNLRNVGGTPGNNNWQQQAFNPGSFANPQFASGSDVAIMSAGQNQLLVFDPNLSNTGGFSFPAAIPQGQTSPTISGNYYTIGSYIYYRNPQAQWNALPVGLIGLGLPESVQNRGPNYIAYQDSGGNTAQTYVVTLSNGSGSNPVALPGQQKIYVPQAQRGGTTLAGPRFLVSYPSSQTFDGAKNLTLYSVDEGSVLDQVTDYPVAFVEVTDAYDPSNSYCSSYFYANSSASQISYNPLTGLAQYPLVFTVPGVKSTGSLPPSVQPQGRTENHYSNGLSPQSLPSPASSSYNYDLILNGFLLMQVQFDATGAAVASQINNWSVERQDALSGNLLYGGYVRMTEGVTSKDGVQQTSTSTYDPASGLQTRAEVAWYDSNGLPKRLRTDTSYAYQAYGGAFLSQHLLTPVAQQTRSVIDSGGAIEYIQSDITTYQNWGGSGYWDAFESYRWTTPGATAPSFDFSGANHPGWLRTSAILKRYMPSGMVQEQSDVTGVRQSFIYDKLVRYQTASFPNASLEGNEASYCGFEDYETGQGWSLGASAAVIPNATVTETDAHTGYKSMRLDPTPAGQFGIQNSFTPQGQGRQYTFSAWVKTPDGFNVAQGRASWTIQFSASGPVGQPLNVDFPDETGKWLFLSKSFSLPAASGPVTVELRAANANTSSYVLIDDVSFSPLDSIFTEQVFNTYYWLVNAGLGPNGECTRTVYGQFEETVAKTNVADQAWSMSATYFSRKGNQGKFSPNDPNQSLSIQYAGGGNVFDFAAGSEWRSIWQPGNGNVWGVTNGLALSGSGTLTLAGNPSSSYGLRMRFAPLEPVAQPLGINCGGSVSVVWEPSVGQWQLLVNGKQVASVAPATQFSLPAQQFASSLNAPQLPADLRQVFAQHGYVLSSAAALTPLASGAAHALTVPGRAPILYLRAANKSIDVSQVPGDWILTVTGRTMLFYAGGQRIFSYVSGNDLVGAPQLFFNNRVAIAGLVSGADPQIAVTFTDSRGNARQAQSLIGQQAVVSQSFVDNMGRVAVSTKSAYMDPNGSFALMAYRPDFASYDWATNALTGYVNAAYPNDGGYPYTRQVYESSALSRVIERGIPGSDFAVGAHSTRFIYGTNDASSGLPPNQYLRSTTIDPNGDQTWQLATGLQQTVMKVSIQQTPTGPLELKNFTVFNDYGFAAEMRAPNYYNPPPNSSPNDWVTQQSFDYAGRVIQSITRGKNSARLATNYIFDSAGNIRFTQDPQGAHDGNYTYFKYDVLGRPVETGYIAGSWDPTVLQQRASGDPYWPPTPPTWRKRFHYDGAATGAGNSRGRVSQTQANNGTAGVADVTEAFEYDISGNRVNVAQTVLTGLPYTFQYSYDNLGNIVKIGYPANLGVPALSLGYQYNQLNQVRAIVDEQNPSFPIATFTYEPNGRPASQVLDPLGSQQVATQFGFNSPLWIGSIGYATKNQSALLVETLAYTNGGRNGVAYYNGQVASEAIQSTGVETGSYTLRYAYDSIGAVAGAECIQKPDFAIGAVAYDANGNFTAFQQGTQTRAYTYFNGTQQVSQVADSGNGQVYATYDYDLNGNALSATLAATGWSDAHQLAFTYDPALKLTQSVNDSVGAQWNLSFTYGAYNQRVLKTSRNAAQNATKLYLFGTSSYPLVEKIDDSKSGSSVTQYVFGPGGLIAMDRAGQRFRVLRDHLGSTRMVLDANANVVAEYDYLSFGSVAAKAEPTQGFMSYLYSGQEFDWEAGLYNYRARFYDSNLGRFLSVDPKRQYFSPYIYASNNPVLFIDPTGRFSIGSFFSALAGAIIGAVEILIGVVVDIIAGVLEVVTGGLSTPASIALASLAGAFYGAGSSALLYSAFHFADFDWRSYGIEMGIGAVTGAISFGFGAAGGAAAEAATGVKAAVEAGVEVSQAAKAANTAIQTAFNITGGAVADAVGTTLGDVAYGTTPGADVAQAFYWGVISGFVNALVPSIDYKAGWGELGKRVVAGVGSSIAVGVPLTVAQNLATGNKWDEGLLNTVAGGAVWGTIGSLQVGDATKAALDFKFDFQLTF